MTAPICFFDIAAPDDEALKAFYSKVFGWTFNASGQFETPVVLPLSAAIRRDPAEKRLYVGVPDVAACLETIEANGGSIDAPRFEVAGLAVIGLFRDPAGNEMGVVELDGEKLRVP